MNLLLKAWLVNHVVRILDIPNDGEVSHVEVKSLVKSDCVGSGLHQRFGSERGQHDISPWMVCIFII